MHFGKFWGDEVKGRSPKKLKSLIDLCSAPESTGSKFQCDPDLIYVACSQTELSISGEYLGDQVKDRSPKKLKLLIRVPYVARLKVQVLRFHMILTSSP